MENHFEYQKFSAILKNETCYLKNQMGCFSSCNKNNVQIDLEDQYKTLVVTKPAPVVLNPVNPGNNSDSDVPLFEQVSSDSDEQTIPAPESITDEELNLYAESLNKKLD